MECPRPRSSQNSSKIVPFPFLLAFAFLIVAPCQIRAAGGFRLCGLVGEENLDAIRNTFLFLEVDNDIECGLQEPVVRRLCHGTAHEQKWASNCLCPWETNNEWFPWKDLPAHWTWQMASKQQLEMKMTLWQLNSTSSKEFWTGRNGVTRMEHLGWSKRVALRRNAAPNAALLVTQLICLQQYNVDGKCFQAI